MHVPDSEDCLLFLYEFTGIISGDKILEQVDSDMLRYLDEDFHIEMTTSIINACPVFTRTKKNFLLSKQPPTL